MEAELEGIVSLSLQEFSSYTEQSTGKRQPGGSHSEGQGLGHQIPVV